MSNPERLVPPTPSGIERKLAAILSADVKGFSRLMGEDEEATLRTLTASRQVTDTLIQQHRGRIVGTAGDSILAEFASVVDAVQCAVEIQTALKTENANLPTNRRMEFRIGINLGDVMVEGEQIYGDGVNIAARLEALAEAGGICISGAVYEQIKNKLTLHYEDLGEQVLKNIAEPVQVWRVRIELPSPGQPQEVAPTILSDETTPSLPLSDKPSIVVLPFVNLSSDPEQEYFSDGITEDLTSSLSQLSGLFVIARNSAFAYKGKAVKVQEVSRELGVRYVLEGSVRKAGNRVRITAQLIDATTGYHLWSERYDRELKDIFALQDEIVQKLVTTLNFQFTLWEQGILVRKHTDNLEAYDSLLRGLEYYNHFTKEANAQARQMFERAIALDPQYAQAYASASLTYFYDWFVQWDPDSQNLNRAFALAQKAITQSDSLPQAHLLLGLIYLYQKQHDQALAETERAIALDPNNGTGYKNLWEILVFMGQPEKGLMMIEKAIRLNPHVAYYVNALGWAYYWLGRYEEAVMAFKRAIPRSPNIPVAYIGLAATYSALGREAEARAEVAEVLRVSPQFSLAVWQQRLPFKDQAVLERHINDLRKAGLE
ncbi:MAG TPA: adenylate/guanylate cyclase domain-containing protein [Candidatus Binatia bacterium]|nr:adenylate/guanylate cyclase domain-containing protein [Candidatus Binatia bacterium]